MSHATLKPLPVIACLLIATAATLIFVVGRNDGNPSSPPASTRVITRERPALSASSTAKFIDSLRHLGHAERQDQVRALSDADLQRLTRAMTAEYLSATDDISRRSSVSLLTLLAMEYGRRDFDGLLAEIKKCSEQDPSIDLYPRFYLYCAAVAGLAAENPQRAADYAAESPTPFTDSPVPSRHLSAAIETIFRAWARMNPDAAWQAVSAGLENGEFLPVQALLAETKDPSLRNTILDRISKLVANSQTSDEPVTLNVIETTINANRDELKVFTALGLAEQNPDAAWEWIKERSIKDDEVPILGDIPLIARLFGSPSKQFLSEWAVRQPEQAKTFLNQHADVLSMAEQAQLASGLLFRDPVSALEAFPMFSEPTKRLEWFSNWIQLPPPHSNEYAWPVLPYLNDTLPRSQILSTVSENLGHLHLPSDLKAQALQTVRTAQRELGHPQDSPPE